MEASGSNHSMASQGGNGPPATPSHPSLLPALSPSSTLEQTPAPLHSLPPHLQHGLSVPRPSSANRPSHLSHGSHHAHGPPIPQPQFVIPGAAHVAQPPPQSMLPPGGGVFGVVMGSAPGQVPADQTAPGNAKVYASVYSGIPVYEAMIRGISVMRRTSDSWVNATQILKVAGIPKSTRTKILEKEILPGIHEKVQGGYGKYQGTWIPLERGRDLAAQYGVDSFLNCIFDFVPSSGDVAALPLQRDPSASGGPKKTPNAAAIGYTPGLTPTRVASPYTQTMAQYPPENVILQSHPSALAYPSGVYYEGRNSLAPPADIAALGLPPNDAPVYIDQYGRTHPTHRQELHQNGDGQPPTKRARVEPQEEEQVAEWVETDDDEPMAPVPASFRLSTKPVRPKSSASQQRVRNKLLSLFQTDEQFDLQKVLGLDVEEENRPEIDIDMVIDDLGHTALHWAAATAKPNVARQLIDLGADIHRGNYAGETPLIRAVLTNNLSEQGGYAEILTLLGPSIRTLDHSYRSVLHHIALVAGVKGRAACAREYMTGLLDFVAREGQPQLNGHGNQAMKNLLDIQDAFGDTALNLAARVGNVPLIKLLLDSGADKARENKHGLKPVDYGLEVEALRLSPGEAVVASLKAEVPKPERYSRDVQKNIAAIFETINDTFSSEMTEVQTRLNATEQSVRQATKSLAEKRQQLLRAQVAIGDLEQVKQKVSNVKRSIDALSTPEWTSGRVPLSREASAPSAFQPVSLPGFTPSSDEVTVPQRGESDALIRLRRINAWEDRIDNVLRDRLAQVQSLQGTTDKAVKYRRLIAAILRIPLAEVESSLPTLVQATQSDGSGVDAGRIGALLARFKEAGKQLQGSRLIPSA